MREAEEVAKQTLKDNFIKGETDGLYTSFSIMENVLTKALNSYAQAQRSEALEGAARFVENKPNCNGPCHKEIAAAIRALNKPKESGE